MAGASYFTFLKHLSQYAMCQISRPMQRKLFLSFLSLVVVSNFLFAQLKEIRSIQSELPAIKDSIQYVDALNRLALLAHLKSVDSCFLYAEKAKNIADRLKYKKGDADALNTIGIVYAIKTNTYLATKYFNQALNIYKDIGDSSNQCQLIMNLGVVLTIDKKPAEALDYFKTAYKIGNTLSHDSIQSIVIINLISADTTLSTDSVFTLLKHAKAIGSKYHDERILLVCNETQASLLIKQDKRGDAIELLQNSILYADSIGCEYERMNIYITLGDILIKDDSKQAIQYYSDVLKTSSTDGYTDYITASAGKLYDYYISIKDTIHANQYADLLLKEYRDYQQFVQQSGISYLDYALKDKELENVKANSEVRRDALIIVSILTVIIMILLFFMLLSIRSRKKFVELLKQRNEMAQSRNTELHNKNEFNNRLISLLAHDFRQPLAAVKGMMTLLREPGALSKEELDHLVANIERSSNTSLEIFDNILHWIKKQVSGFIYEPADMPLKELVEEAARSLQYITDKFNITIKNEVADGTTITADKEMLQFVNRNLIHNAIKFSPANSAVTINAIKNEKGIIVLVKDEGKGMTKEKVDSLFNIFSKTQYTSDKEKGSGVALVICKEFIERMSGHIWAESEPGKGTTFLYSLPLKT